MTFNYDDLLKRAREQMPEVQAKKERLELPRIQIQTVGMRTTIANFKEIADALDRDPQHLTKIPNTRNGHRRHIPRFTRHLPRQIPIRQLRATNNGYLDGYVVCPVCKRPDTKLVKEKRLAFLVCNACGAKSAIKQL